LQYLGFLKCRFGFKHVKGTFSISGKDAAQHMAKNFEYKLIFIEHSNNTKAIDNLTL